MLLPVGQVYQNFSPYYSDGRRSHLSASVLFQESIPNEDSDEDAAIPLSAMSYFISANTSICVKHYR